MVVFPNLSYLSAEIVIAWPWLPCASGKAWYSWGGVCDKYNDDDVLLNIWKGELCVKYFCKENEINRMIYGEFFQAHAPIYLTMFILFHP